MTRPQSDCGDRFFYNCILIIFMHFLRVWLLPCRIIMHVSCQWCKSQMKCDMIVQTAHTEKTRKKSCFRLLWQCFFVLGIVLSPQQDNAWFRTARSVKLWLKHHQINTPTWAGRSSDLIPLKTSGVWKDGRLLPSNIAEAPSFFTEGEHAKTHKLSLKV